MKRPEFRKRDIERSRELRRDAPPAERKLWEAISAGKLSGHRFTRQFQIGPYFCDLVCRSAKLIVEIDGFSHNMRVDHDMRRDAFLVQQGFRVLRFTNEDVMTNLEGVVIAISLALGPSPSPSRKREGSLE
jgi:very-short-patch-repair endonuclease